MGGIDLHTHTNLSDGTFTPTELVDQASERGLEVVAITDHDTTGGLREATSAAGRVGIEVVPGVEFSAEHLGSSVHVLCYWMDPENAELQDELRRLQLERFHRGEAMVSKLQALGYPIAFERVREIARADSIVRPHIAQALVEAGVVGTEEEAFDRLIGDDGPAYVPKHALDPIDGLGLIRRAGGVCVLAHPGMWITESAVPGDLIEAMAQAGMVGLETEHSDHTPEQREYYRGVAKRLGLVATGGSDCHGTRYDPVRLGTVTTDPEQFRALRAAAGR